MRLIGELAWEFTPAGLKTEKFVEVAETGEMSEPHSGGTVTARSITGLVGLTSA